jgi:hypothetical protein
MGKQQVADYQSDLEPTSFSEAGETLKRQIGAARSIAANLGIMLGILVALVGISRFQHPELSSSSCH